MASVAVEVIVVVAAVAASDIELKNWTVLSG